MSFASISGAEIGQLIEDKIPTTNVGLLKKTDTLYTRLYVRDPLQKILYSRSFSAGAYHISATISVKSASDYVSASLLMGKLKFLLSVDGEVKHQTSSVFFYDGDTQTINLSGSAKSSSPILVEIGALPMKGVTTGYAEDSASNTTLSSGGYKDFSSSGAGFLQISQLSAGFDMSGTVTLMRCG